MKEASVTVQIEILQQRLPKHITCVSPQIATEGMLPPRSSGCTQSLVSPHLHLLRLRQTERKLADGHHSYFSDRNLPIGVAQLAKPQAVTRCIALKESLIV